VIVWITEQPKELKGKEYNDLPKTYQYLELWNDGKKYAAMGLQLVQDVVYVYAAHLNPSPVDWREYRRNDLPELIEFVRGSGAKHVACASNEFNNGFDQVVKFLGFTSINKIAIMEV
jgi:hypothetical protein